MAVDKLQHLANQFDGVFQDQPCHDLDSIFWVNLHTLYRRAIRRAPTADKQEALFNTLSNYFGHIEIKDMYSSRLRLLRDLSHVNQHPRDGISRIIELYRRERPTIYARIRPYRPRPGLIIKKSYRIRPSRL